MNTVTVTIPGRLGGKGRHRSFVRNGKVLHVAQAKTMTQEALVRSFAALEMRKHKLKMMLGPMAVSVTICLQTPKSWSKKKRLAAIWATGKPDLDNVAKLLLDSVLGTVMRDDAQVAMLSLSRVYNDNDGEHVMATFEELEA